MMKKSFLMFSFAAFFLSNAQVSIEKNRLIKNGESYKFSQYDQVFTNSVAKDYFKKSRSNSTIGNIFGGIGGGCIGFGLARALSGGNNNKVSDGINTYVIKKDNSGAWSLVGIGAGLIGIGIPFALAANKNAEKAIAIENGESVAFIPYFQIETAANGLALSYNF